VSRISSYFVAVLLLIASAMAMVGVGTSAAKDPYVGLTYADASAKIAGSHGTAVISTVVGDVLATDDCIVTSWRKATYATTDNFEHGNNYLLSLNCNAKVAAAGVPGNSIATPEGQAQKQVEKTAADINRSQGWCKQHLDRCKKFCDTNSGMCSKTVMDLF